MPHFYLASCFHLAGAVVTDVLRLLPGVRRA